MILWLGALIAAVMMLAATQASAGEVLDEIKANCAAEWGEDFAMQKWCRDEQIAAAKKVARLLAENPKGTVGYRILRRCFGEWRGKIIGTDYAMVHWCAEEQFNAYKALQE